MSKISERKKERIKEDILSVLFESGIKGRYTYQIAEEVIRDDEFVFKLLEELEKKKLIKRMEKSLKGRKLSRKKLWVMTDGAYDAYSKLITIKN